MERSVAELVKHIGKFLGTSSEAYGIFNGEDHLIGCNHAFANLFGDSPDAFLNRHFDDLVRNAFRKQHGIKIDSGDVEQFIDMTKTRRRSAAYRVFEVDMLDGLWFLFSEQTLANGDMLIHARDITKQKKNEFELHAKSSKLRKLALTDELTQIANRRSFINSVNAEISRCSRNKAKMAFLLLDIDYFKNVNDTYGHLAGDAVLINITQLITVLLREYDVFGRLGGEEFGIFLADTDLNTATEIAQRIREKIQQHVIEIDHQKMSVTVSIGIALLNQATKFETLYKRADVALYQAKNGGRNKVVVSDQG
ncbi:MAG: diguanylate cyclase [Paraglaciecola sp.]|uniref:GGDEF domain-containing protein n=1 Tax=Paraglaciecola sp. TaxID=1920173 RepID=UPI00273EDD58|nr:sensor domain-containing diguanylate cyclase [Paraglaciecola sp.]MDP5031121.1 diguanylate cyclase [Paraglaciecola sp.]MDP5132797.1 diguanylate cyclase [Paraglaciecola sp.]